MAEGYHSIHPLIKSSAPIQTESSQDTQDSQFPPLSEDEA